MRRIHRRLIAALVVAAAFAPAAPALSHELPVFVFPHDARVTTFDSSFGAPRSEGRSHEGNDLFAPKMSPVYAVLDGTVTKVGSSGRAGNHVFLVHDGGWESRYMHLNDDTPGTDDGRGGKELAFAPGVEVGASVVAGQIIGYVGDSGNAAGGSAHTHVEIRHGGAAVDPFGILRDARDRALAAAEAERVGELEARMA